MWFSYGAIGDFLTLIFEKRFKELLIIIAILVLGAAFWYYYDQKNTKGPEIYYVDRGTSNEFNVIPAATQ